MVGTYITVRPISAEAAAKIRKRQRIINKLVLYTAGAATLALAVETFYRFLGDGDPTITNYISQVGKGTLFATGIAAILNNRESKGVLYTGGAAILTLAAESIYRNLGGDPVTANFIFQTGGYILLGAGITAILDNPVVGPEAPSAGLESKVSNS